MKADLPVPVKQKKLYSSLTSQIDNGHFANAVKTTDKLLRLDPSDTLAQKTRLWLLLQTEQYEKALEVTKLDSDDELVFEKAYALYRLQREDEAASVVQQLKQSESETTRGALHLEAQISYRRGQYQVAYDIYNDLLDTAESNSEEQSDIQTNLNSTQSHLDFISSGFHTSLSRLPRFLTDKLEDLPPPSLIYTSNVARAQPSAAAPSNLPPKEKPPRKSRIPKNVVIGQTPLPDPERWLKKSERSTFQVAKGKKGKGGGASQGITPLDVGVSSGGSSGGGGKKGKKRK